MIAGYYADALEHVSWANSHLGEFVARRRCRVLGQAASRDFASPSDNVAGGEWGSTMSWIVVGAMVAAIASVAPAAAAQSGSRVVLADQRFVVTTAAGSGLLPIYLSADWTQPRPEATRALLIFHGTGRNAHSYFITGKKARELAGEENAGALIIAPHFIEQADLEN